MILPIRNNEKNISLLSLTEEIKSLKQQLSSLTFSYKIEISTRDKKIYIDEKNIVMIEAKGNYSDIHLIDGKSILTSKTLKYWQNKIQSNFLHRIHASYFVNINFISEIQINNRIVLLDNALSAKVSKENLKDLCETMKGFTSHKK